MKDKYVMPGQVQQKTSLVFCVCVAEELKPNNIKFKAIPEWATPVFSFSGMVDTIMTFSGKG